MQNIDSVMQAYSAFIDLDEHHGGGELNINNIAIKVYILTLKPVSIHCKV